jgi:uncharacterized phage protein gp47/JayE
MIGSFGVLSTGVVIKRVDDISLQVGQSLSGDLGAAFSLLSQTPEGQLVNRLSEQVADLWELGEQVYNALYPDTANGVNLDNARNLTNQFRIPATASVVNGVVLTGTPGASIPGSLQLSVVGAPASIFQISAATTIGGGGTVTASFVATAVGPTQALAGTLTNIVTPVSGLVSVSNPSNAQLGTYTETDSAFRLRSAQNLSRPGTGTFSGLMQSVLAVPNVSQAFEFLNDSDVTDGSGLPPHSVLLVVTGGVDQDVLNAIFAAKAAGIQTSGSTTGTVTDSQGTAHSVSFSRLAALATAIYVDVTIIPNVNPSAGPIYPANGNSLVQAAIAATTFAPGQTVVATSFFTAVNSVPGVLGATILIDTAPSPTLPNNIPITLTHIAQVLAANVTVHE